MAANSSGYWLDVSKKMLVKIPYYIIQLTTICDDGALTTRRQQ